MYHKCIYTHVSTLSRQPTLTTSDNNNHILHLQPLTICNIHLCMSDRWMDVNRNICHILRHPLMRVQQSNCVGNYIHFVFMVPKFIHKARGTYTAP